MRACVCACVCVCVCVCVRACMCVCVCVPLRASGVVWALFDWLNNFCCFSVLIDVFGPSNIMGCQLQPRRLR